MVNVLSEEFVGKGSRIHRARTRVRTLGGREVPLLGELRKAKLAYGENLL